MGRSVPIHLIVHHPQTQEGKLELACRVAEVHANAVQRRIKELSCPNSQKLALLDAVIEDARTRVQAAPEKTSHRTSCPEIFRA